MPHDDNPEFFIGWQGTVPPRTRRKLVRLTVALAIVACGGAIAFAALQGTIGRARWDYGNVREFTGVLLAQPVPTLVVDTAPHLLVFPNKFGFDPVKAREFDGERVRLSATVLQRDNQSMLEVRPDSITRLGPGERADESPAAIDLGEHALRGEIVDSKCFLGAMNPGVLKPHRACAILCISGGIPPVLLVRDAAGTATCYLLVGPEGEPINRDVLDFVAEPVEIRGRVQRLGKQLVLRASPDAIERLP